MKDWGKVLDTLQKGDNFLLVCHVSPDGDSIGSILALGLALKQLGKKIMLVCDDQVPYNLYFLAGCELIRKMEILPTDIEVIVALDCADIDRMGRLGRQISESKMLINIDHHTSNPIYGHYNLVDEQAAATGEIIFKLLKDLKIRMTWEIASALYTAILTDTGCFCYQNTTSTTHQIAAELLEYGVMPAYINEKVYETKSLASIALLSRVLQTLQLSKCKRIAWVTVTNQVLRELGAEDEPTEGLINYPRSIEGVEVSLLFCETPEGDHIKVSFRSRGECDVSLLASTFGGGGHPKAAGCLIQGRMEEVQRKVIAATQKALEGIGG